MIPSVAHEAVMQVMCHRHKRETEVELIDSVAPGTLAQPPAPPPLQPPFVHHGDSHSGYVGVGVGGSCRGGQL